MDGIGTTLVLWEDIRGLAMQANPDFTSIVDKLSPGKELPLLLANYEYGALLGDAEGLLLPVQGVGYCRLSLPNPNIPKEVSSLLAYANNSAPLCMILDKSFEYFIDFQSDSKILPWSIRKRGDFLSIFKYFANSHKKSYTPEGLFTATAGARSAFMLPSIGSSQNFMNLLRDFKVQGTVPKSLHEHWYTFKDIASHGNSEWRAKILFFSDKWLNKIYYDKAWFDLKLYLHEKTLQRLRFEQNSSYYDVIFSMIQRKRNLKPSPYLVDTARYFFSMAGGAAIGYIPTCTDELLPLNTIQNAFVSSYGLKKYIPTIMSPSSYDFKKESLPIYYSLQHPTTRAFSPRSRRISSTITELYELQRIIKIFIEELSEDARSLCANTVLSKIAKNCNFSFYHNESDPHEMILPSTSILEVDERFLFYLERNNDVNLKFAQDGKFLRGCISICSENT